MEANSQQPTANRSVMEKLLWWIVFQIQIIQVVPFIIATQCRRYHRCSTKSEQQLQRKGVTYFVRSRPQNIRGGDIDVDEDDRELL